MKTKANWKELGKQLWAAVKPALLAAIGGGIVTVAAGCSSLVHPCIASRLGFASGDIRVAVLRACWDGRAFRVKRVGTLELLSALGVWGLRPHAANRTEAVAIALRF